MTAAKRGNPGSRSADRAGRLGFTLLEVLATLALAGISLPVVIHGVLLSLEATAVAQDRNQAAMLARNLLAETIATGDTSDAESEGGFGEDHPRFRWVSSWSEWDDPLLLQLEVTVHWTRRGRDRNLTLTTLAYQGAQ